VEYSLKDTDYPALYQSSSELSLNSQHAFYRAFCGHIFLLVTAAIISVINSPYPEVAISQALVLALALACAVYLFVIRPDRHWYSGRAVAESIKTITWRFVSKAEPFHVSDEIARQKFRLTLKSIVEQNKDVAQRLTTHLDGIQISEAMHTLRQAGVDERRQHYIESRIVDQQHWYAKKAAFNKRKVNQFFSLLMITNVVAFSFALAKIRFPTAPYWPTDVLVTIAAGLLSWIQAKRFQELAASYALAAHEISLIREQAANNMTDPEFSEFVGNAENAFSREHTQWVARRDD
jgi:hypothetical protein